MEGVYPNYVELSSYFYVGKEVYNSEANELAEKVKIPKEMDGWDDMSVEERYQRDLNYGRVKKQIAPYFAGDESRFFGAIIVAAMNFSTAVFFEPLSDVATKGLPKLYKTGTASMGFLIFSGGEVLVPLDGQHRLKAIEFAISGRDENGKNIPGITPCTQLADEDVSVILVPYEPTKARKIFTRVNRYARPTTTGQNIVTDDDDIIAVLAREVSNDLIGARLVKYMSNTLSSKDIEFTTLSTVYNCNENIIRSTFSKGRIDTSKLPEEKTTIRLFRDKVREVWEVLLEEIEVFADAISDSDESGDEKRKEIRANNLLGKPVTQECLVRAFMRLTDQSTNNMAFAEACKKLNTLPWSITEENLRVWDRILWLGGTDGKIITKNRILTTDIIAHLAGAKFEPEQKEKLLSDYLRLFKESERKGKELPELT